MNNPLKEQVGGTHYKAQEYQVIQFLQDSNLNTSLGYAVKYISRYPRKNPDDLDKAIHCIELFQHWFNEKVKEDTILQYLNDNMELKDVLKFTHQYEPEKAMLLQQVIELGSFTIEDIINETLNDKITNVITDLTLYKKEAKQ